MTENEEVIIDRPIPAETAEKTDLAKDPSMPQEIPIELAEETPEDFTPQPTVPPPPEHNNRKLYLAIGVSALIFIIIFVFIFKAIFSFFGASRKSIELVYWGLWENEATVAPLIKTYEKQHPKVKIQYAKQDVRDYREKLVARVREGRGPDIFRFHNTWLPEIADVAAPLPSKVMTSEQFEKTFYPVTRQDLKIENNYYGIPLEIDGLVMIYNGDLFKAAGLSGPPKTWNDVLSDAGSLLVQDAEGNIITSGIAMGTSTNVEHFSDIFGTILLQNGGKINNLKGHEAVEALRFYRSFAEPPTPFWDETMDNNVNAFVQGKVGMIFVPTWQILNIKNSNPRLNLKVAPMPVLPGSPLLSVSNYWVEGVSRASKNQEEAWKFLEFLSQKESMTRSFELQVKEGRLFGEPYSRVDLKSTLVDDPYLGPLMEEAENLRSIPMIARTQDNGLNDEIIKYLRDAITATSQGISYEASLETAESGVIQVLKKFSIE